MILAAVSVKKNCRRSELIIREEKFNSAPCMYINTIVKKVQLHTWSNYTHLHDGSVVLLTASLNGPSPLIVAALTLISYIKNSSKLVRVRLMTGANTWIVWELKRRPSKVSEGSYKTSCLIISPFWSMSITGSHVTEISVGERASALTLVGGLAGTIERQDKVLNFPESKV